MRNLFHPTTALTTLDRAAQGDVAEITYDKHMVAEEIKRIYLAFDKPAPIAVFDDLDLIPIDIRH